MFCGGNMIKNIGIVSFSRGIIGEPFFPVFFIKAVEFNQKLSEDI